MVVIINYNPKNSVYKYINMLAKSFIKRAGVAPKGLSRALGRSMSSTEEITLDLGPDVFAVHSKSFLFVSMVKD